MPKQIPLGSITLKIGQFTTKVYLGDPVIPSPIEIKENYGEMGELDAHNKAISAVKLENGWELIN